MSDQGKDFYRTLGVSEKADRDEIRKAYRALAKKYHPDANKGDESASERFKEIGEAYRVLSDPDKRKKYDQMRKYGAFGAAARGFGGRTDKSPSSDGPGFGGFRRRPGGPGGGAPGSGPGREGSFSFEDLGGLGDIFSSIFDRGQAGGTASASRPSGPSRGEDVDVTAEISFETAVRGGSITLKVPITESCASCSGSGATPGSGLSTCSECGGGGTVSFGQGGFSVNRPCPACGGRGQVPSRPCTSCGGSGAVRQTRTLQVTVPAGVESGSRMRLSGQGQRGSEGGPPGDILLEYKVKPHRFFRRDGLDIHVTVPINIAQATLGSKVRVRTIDGRRVALRIPAGTQTGTRFRLRDHGVKKGERSGDQFVEVRVTVPEDLSDDQREAMATLAESAGLRY